MIGGLTPELALLHPPAGTSTELLRLMAAHAEQSGHVLGSFADAVVAREARFPTGLPTPVPAAIPHTDAGHVVRTGVVAALLDQPVDFGEMGSADPGRTVPARLVLMLLVREPDQQVEALGTVVGLLQDPALADRLARVTTPEELVAALQPVPAPTPG